MSGKARLSGQARRKGRRTEIAGLPPSRAAADTARPGDLVQSSRAHRDVYTDRTIFAREQERIFGRAWIYACHESQIRNSGDFVAVTIAGRPVVVVRSEDGGIKALQNRCAHRGALVANTPAGNVKRFVCSYHGWIYRLDGALEGVPLREDYANSGFERDCDGGRMTPLPRVASYRGFVFTSLAAAGPDLPEFLGAAAANLDNMIERAPAGEIEIAGGSFRTLQRSNWKIYLENLHDGLHALPTHRSSIKPARKAAAEAQSERTRLQAEIVAANGLPPRAMAKLRVNCYARGHSDMSAFRVSRAAHPDHRAYEAALAARVGADGVERILGLDRQNALIYPSLTVQTSYMQLRAVVPLAVDLTRVDVWLFRLKGAPDWMNERIVAYANVIHSPASSVRADDLENYERVHAGLASGDAAWVSQHRRLAAEPGTTGASSAMSERFIRNQLAAWRAYMEDAA